MPIVVRHEPAASAVLDVAQIAGEGAFNKWKTEFEARQKQYAFQNLMSGLSAGQSLAAPFINIAGQQAQRGFQAGEAEKARKWQTGREAQRQGHEQEMARQRFQMTEELGPLAQMEARQGQKFADERKEINGLVPQAIGLYHPDTGALRGAASAPTMKDIYDMSERGDLVNLKRIVARGQSAMQSTMQMEAETNPGAIKRRVAAKAAVEAATRKMRIEQEEQFIKDVTTNPNNPGVTQDQNTRQFSSTDAPFAKMLNHKLARIRAMRLGLDQLPLAQRVEFGTHPYVGTDGVENGFWVDPNLGLQHVGGGGRGRSGAGAGTEILPDPGEDGRPEFTQKQRDFYYSQEQKLTTDYMEQFEPNPLAVATWSTRNDNLQNQIDAHQGVLDDPNADTEKQAASSTKIASLKRTQAEHQREMPRGINQNHARQMAQQEMFRRTGGLKPPDDPSWRSRPFAAGFPSRFYSRGQREQVRAFLGQQADPRWQAHVTTPLPQNPTLRNVGTALIQSYPGMTLRQAMEALSKGAASFRGPQPGVQQPPGVLPQMGGQTSGGGMPPGGGQPRAYQAPPVIPVRGRLDYTRVAGPAVSSEAFDRLMTDHRALGASVGNLSVEFNRIFANKSTMAKVNTLIRQGKRLRDNPRILSELLQEADRQMVRLARKTEAGGRFTPTAGALGPGAGVTRGDVKEAVGSGKRAVSASGMMAQRKVRYADLVESAVKWSHVAKPGGPVSLAAIPAPKKEEFYAMVARDLVKPGDVLVKPPEYLNGVKIADSAFMIVSKKAIDTARGVLQIQRTRQQNQNPRLPNVGGYLPLPEPSSQIALPPRWPEPSSQIVLPPR